MTPDASLETHLAAAAEAIRHAEALLIGAGAGMGVDSGLPDFRGPEGFWKAYPPFRGKEFAEISNPHWFVTDPALAWGFFGHRLGLYRAAIPHEGFQVLRRWSGERPAFVFTSNVDGQFQKAGFGETDLLECHGSIHHLQCLGECGRPIWPATDVSVEVDETTMRALSDLPRCPDCGALARPNILMFGDGEWDASRSALQEGRYDEWLDRMRGRRIVAIELGAGLAIPTVRRQCETYARTLIRINPREPATPRGGIPIPLGALDALRRLDAR
ncbi:MAG TPA: Sir2 family NAD-dependent protein deacetylase [Chthoniobacteraceae bacterium]|jgi:NAD-dependent SIR2 family protein deacetylase|nr:Sir2 family NAD-dependent protein deacetylase [Chthoniobacteraceae bacterium]